MRWHAGAQDELAGLWLASDQRSNIERAANGIDQLLAFGPASKGAGGALATLDEESCRIIAERAAALPEDLRGLRMGPLEVLFVAKEDDCMAIVYRVRLRTQP